MRVRSLAALLAPVVLGCAERPREPREPTPGAFHFTVQSYNVEQHDWDDPATIAAIGVADADIVVLQETTPRWEETVRAAYRDRYPEMLFRVRTEDVAGGLAVLSRFPLRDLAFHPEPHDWHPAWHVGVVTPVGTIQLLAIHLRAPLNGHSSALEAWRQVEEDHLREIQAFTAGCLKGLPTVVLGDFNETPDGPALRHLEDTGFTNILPLFHPGQGTWRYRSIAGQFDRAYDHILASPDFEPLDAWVKRIGNSDHLPVVAHLEFATGAPNP